MKWFPCHFYCFCSFFVVVVASFEAQNELVGLVFLCSPVLFLFLFTGTVILRSRVLRVFCGLMQDVFILFMTKTNLKLQITEGCVYVSIFGR